MIFSDEAVDLEDWKRARSESGTAACETIDGAFLPNSACTEAHYIPQKRVSLKIKIIRIKYLYES